MTDESQGLPAANALLRDRIAELEAERSHVYRAVASAARDLASRIGPAALPEWVRGQLEAMANRYAVWAGQPVDSRLAELEAERDRLQYDLTRLSLDVNRLHSGDYRALHPENQWLCDVGRERDALARFKTWVHAYLDAQDVPHHPPGPHGAEGCRIGDRLDWLLGRLRGAEADRDRYARLLLDAHHVAWGRGDQYAGLPVGLCDAVDPGGRPYPSQWCADTLQKAAQLLGRELEELK